MSDYLPYPAPNIPKSYDVWKIERQKLPTLKRKITDDYQNQWPAHDYFRLPLGNMMKDIESLCDKGAASVKPFSRMDSETMALEKSLIASRAVPRDKPFTVAFLGGQGNGKSSMINAILGREVVTASSETQACTAIQTDVVYKMDASDDTKLSDVSTTCLNEEERDDAIEEQINRYTDLYPYKASENRSDLNNTCDTDNETAFNATNEQPQSSTEHDLDSKRLGAETAQQFFEFLFNVTQDPKSGIILRQHLKESDIRNGEDIREGGFFKQCVSLAKQRCAEIEKQHGAYTDVHDSDLENIRAKAEKCWPLVRKLQIATGHELLRNNLSFMDLPGYGDTNLLRNALIDRARDDADFEIIVAPALRFETAAVQRQYIDRTLRRRGPEKSLLLLNKADALVQDIRKKLGKIREEPFLTLQTLFEECKALQRTCSIHKDASEKSLLAEYQKELLQAARSSWILHQGSTVQKGLKSQDGLEIKRLRVLPTSAYQYQLHNEGETEGGEVPSLDVVATGIPTLRQVLLLLPAHNNYKSLSKHIFRTLPDIKRQMRTIKVKYTDNTQFESMRQILDEGISTLQESRRCDGSLDELSDRLIEACILEPFCVGDISPKKEKNALDQWRYPKLHHASFAKGLRDSGILTSGVAKGKNFNREVMELMRDPVNNWKSQLQNQCPDLADRLFEPMKTLLSGIKDRLDKLDHGQLQQDAIEALQIAEERIGVARTDLKFRLEEDVNIVYFAHTSETSIKDPMAKIMKPLYVKTLRFGLSLPKGTKGKTHQMIDHLTEEFQEKNKSVSMAFAGALVNAMESRWRQSCSKYADEALEHLQKLLQTTRDMVNRESWERNEHRDLRNLLEKVIPEFEMKVRGLQRNFEDAKISKSDEPAAKKARLMKDPT